MEVPTTGSLGAHRTHRALPCEASGSDRSDQLIPHHICRNARFTPAAADVGAILSQVPSSSLIRTKDHKSIIITVCRALVEMADGSGNHILKIEHTSEEIQRTRHRKKKTFPHDLFSVNERPTLLFPRGLLTIHSKLAF